MQHKWPSGARFALNCYLHWATLVIRAGDRTGHLLYSKEGVTQGYSLEIVSYGLGILNLVRELRIDHLSTTQPWYADDAWAGGTFEGIRHHLDKMIVQGPPHDYFLETTKSVLFMSPHNVLRAEAFFWGYRLHIVTGRQYLRGFVGTETEQAR